MKDGGLFQRRDVVSSVHAVLVCCLRCLSPPSRINGARASVQELH